MPPYKVERWLQVNDGEWLKEDINLATNRIIRPLNFDTRRQPSNKKGKAKPKHTNMFESEMWTQLNTKLVALGIESHWRHSSVEVKDEMTVGDGRGGL